MRLITNTERPDWQKKAEEADFSFHTMHGEPYWDETAAYAFSLEEIENEIEWPSNQLHAMAMEAAAEIIRDDEKLRRMAIPETGFDTIRRSWAEDRHTHLYGRFDLRYDGETAAKCYEYNADTPTSLFEAGAFQWGWMEDQLASGVLPSGTDQFNGIWEALVSRWATVVASTEHIVHFAGDPDNPEDLATLRVLSETAQEAGLTAKGVGIEAIGYSDEDRRFLDADDQIIGTIFKLYPWEDVLRDEFASLIPGSKTRFVEPAWKAVLSNKGLMAEMWRMFEGHPNLLPCLFEDEIDKGGAFVTRTLKALSETGNARKPLLSREGASITLTSAAGKIEESKPGAYGHHPHVLQALCPLPVFEGRRPVLGTWIVGDTCVGMGIRDDTDMITGDLSRFRPHIITA